MHLFIYVQGHIMPYDAAQWNAHYITACSCIHSENTRHPNYTTLPSDIHPQLLAKITLTNLRKREQ